MTKLEQCMTMIFYQKNGETYDKNGISYDKNRTMSDKKWENV